MMDDRIETLADCLETMCRGLESCYNCTIEEECKKISKEYPCRDRDAAKALAKYLIEGEEK
jgi:hypothetical protein